MAKEEKTIVQAVDKILSLTGKSQYRDDEEAQASVRDHERDIDRLVYQLYGLGPEEIAIVEAHGT
jgi:hypothetical protein